MPPPYFITFHTYGTWLHGDQRGSVDPAHNIYNTPTIAPDARRAAREAQTLRHEPFILDAQARAVVDSTIRAVATHRGWTIHALNVRTNHVHVVVSAAHPPERVMLDFKSWSTRRLTEAGLISSKTKVWSRHGSTRWLNTQHAFDRAREYTTSEQGPDLSMDFPNETRP